MELDDNGVWARESRRIEWRDTDASGHHHNSAIMRLVEAAEATIYRELGFIHLFPESPRVRQEINFRSLIAFDEIATTTVRLQRLGRTSMTFEFEVVNDSRGDDPIPVADGSFTTAYLPNGSESAAPWPAALQAAIRARLAPPGR